MRHFRVYVIDRIPNPLSFGIRVVRRFVFVIARDKNHAHKKVRRMYPNTRKWAIGSAFLAEGGAH